jgi:hypothetical protein
MVVSAREIAPEELAEIQTALETAVSRSTLRGVAGELGMSPSGLTNLLEGARPYGKTVAKLREWYARRVGLDQVRPATILHDLQQYVATLPSPECGVLDVLAAIEHAHVQARRPVPAWVGRVRNELPADAAHAARCP